LNNKILILIAVIGVFVFGSATAMMSLDSPTTVQLYKVSITKDTAPPQSVELSCDPGDTVVSGYVIFPDGVTGEVNTVAINNGGGMIVGQQGATELADVTYQIICAKAFSFPIDMSIVGGELLDINTVSLLVGAIGVNPVITGLVGITLAGIVGQAVWFIHRRQKSEKS